MAQFVLTCLDHPGVLDRRLATRDAHLAYIAEHGAAVKLGGPLLDADGQPNGSLIILEVEDMAAAEAFANKDPYRRANVFERVEIRPFKVTVGGVR
jgi:uncharacterized protein YciI